MAAQSERPARRAQHSSAFPGFTRISRSVWEYAPASPAYSSEKFRSPGLIMLFPWTNGEPRHIQKYINGYTERFPESPIIVVTTTLTDLVFRRSSQKQRALQPTISHIIENYSEATILAHCFSEGGSNKAVEFSEAYLTRSGSRLPVASLILDSTPGFPRFSNLCNAFNNTLPDIALVRLLGFPFAATVIGFLRLFGKENTVIAKTRRRLNDAQHWDLKNMSRTYVYSKTDALISSEDIEEHADESASAGIAVQRVLFEASSHCNHVKEDEERYWKAVTNCWDMRDVEFW
ncbi:hypothetical protein FKW77_004579 [Venturia effusa]|uniref:Indole-diterpene biosynthesis protein PaxU n=1 Tax=Venturia effusa TaxID=50376 RepID=A0A517LLD9_9PEZI|nr:hypothetical protein FKW77_004579 [Venturia effusa]